METFGYNPDSTRSRGPEKHEDNILHDLADAVRNGAFDVHTPDEPMNAEMVSKNKQTNEKVHKKFFKELYDNAAQRTEKAKKGAKNVIHNTRETIKKIEDNFIEKQNPPITE